MRVVFAGTPTFAAVALRELITAGHDVVLVLTQPDRPSGRHRELRASDVKKIALACALPIEQFETLRNEDAVARLRKAEADVVVVVAYGLIFPQAVLNVTPLGCINVHASLLPRWRGAAPIQRAILAGDTETGISIMQMDAGLDTGDILLQRRVPIAEDDTAATLDSKLAEVGAQSIVEVLTSLEEHSLEQVRQGEVGVTYAPKITKDEARIDWTRSAREVDRAVRAYNPAPGAVTSLFDSPVKIWRAQAEAGTEMAAPGEVIQAESTYLRVACGTGALRILELQRAGGRRQTVQDFLRGRAIPRRARLGT